jgi:multidrug resistance efflux pump
VEEDAARPDPSAARRAGNGQVNGSRWPGSDDQPGYYDGLASPYDLSTANGSNARPGRHRVEGPGLPEPATYWVYDARYEDETGMPRDRDDHQNGGAPRDPWLPHAGPPAPSPGPPARPDDYWSAPYQAHPAAPAPPARYPPTAYQERLPVVSAARYPLASYQQPPSPVVPRSHAVSRSRRRVRGMNAALETGVAGVGEMAPARKPARPRQIVVTVLVAVFGLVAGVLTYRSLASAPVSFSGEVVPAHVYALSFGATGTITTVTVHAGEHVTAGEVLAAQNNSLAQANLQEAKDTQAAAAAALYVDEHPQQSSVTREQEAVASAQATLASVTARVSNTEGRDKQTVDARQQAVNSDAASYSSQCGSSTTSSTCQALAAKLATARQELAQAQAAAAAVEVAGQQQEQSDQSLVSERQAALQQVESQASGVPVTLDAAKLRLAAANAAVAQDAIELAGTSIVAPASGTVAAVSAAKGDSVTDNNLHSPVVIVDSGPLMVSAQLPGTEIGEVRPGQAMAFDIQQLQANLPGKVVQVNQMASQSQNAVSYVVLCQIEGHDTALMAGMTVSITPR